MDFNEYTALMLVRERHAEMVAAARRDALLKEATREHAAPSEPRSAPS